MAAVDSRATAIADSLPVSEPEPSGAEADEGEERMPLQDIVITAIEHSEFKHFRIRKYDPDADGIEHEWAIVEPLPEGLKEGEERRPFILDAATVRKGVEQYLDNRLSRGMTAADARMMVDGVYTDVLVCDSIVQFIVYGEEVFG